MTTKRVRLVLDFIVNDEALLEDFEQAPALLGYEIVKQKFEEGFDLELCDVSYLGDMTAKESIVKTITMAVGEPRPAFTPSPAHGGPPSGAGASVSVKHPTEPATPAQITFIQNLIRDRETTITSVPTGLNRGDASAIIESLKKQPWRKKAAVSPAVAGFAIGHYIGKSGAVYQIIENKAKTGTYGEELIEVRPGKWKWTYIRGLAAKMADDDAVAMTKSDAAKFGKRTGHCAICGRTLTDPDSIDKGIGPVCESRLS